LRMSACPQCARKLINPHGTMLLQVVIGAHLAALKDFSIGSLDISITLWMSNRHIADLNAKILKVTLKCAAGELGPIVSDDPVWGPKHADDGLDCRFLVDLEHRGCFQPLCELVDGDVHISKSSNGSGE
jgi:hypothetical protein